MSDPQPAPGKKQPRRAEPIQPDKLGQGDDAESTGNHESSTSEHDDARKEQSDTARKNVREGYD